MKIMYKIIKKIFLPLMLTLLLGSCNKEPEYYTLETPPDQMHLKASDENIILQRVDETKGAITFSWDEATNRGNNVEVVYYFRLYHAAMKNLVSELIKLDKDTRSVTFTVRELNNLLNSWNVSPDEEVRLEAEVLAVVEDSPEYMKPEKSTVQFNITGYEAANRLYLTVESGSVKRNVEMIMLDDGVFNWKGKLDISNFWFVRNSAKGAPAFMKGEAENSVAYSQSGEGNPFKAERYGDYDITIDVNKQEITISVIPINSLFLVTSKNGTEQVTPLVEYAGGTDTYHLQKRFEAGTEYRFVRSDSQLWPAYVKGADNTKLEVKSEGGEMFKITQTETYEMFIDLSTMQITQQVVAPTDKLYLITSKNGIEKVIDLQKVQAGRSVFYLKSDFDAGTEFRFVKNTTTQWPAYVKGVSDTQLAFRTEGSEMFKVSKTATYVMTVNMEDLSLIFLDIYKLPTGVLAVVGGVIPGVAWNAGTAISNSQLSQKDLINRPEVMSYTGRFETKPSGSDDDNSFKFVGDGNWNGGFWAPKAVANPFNTSEQSLVTNNKAGDNKWRLPSGTESGNYTLEVNLHTMKINLVKQ